VITTVVAYLALLPRAERKATGLSEVGRTGLRPVGEIVLSTGGGVAFGGVIAAAGIGSTLVNQFEALHVPILLFGFLLTVVLRAALGTTTAAVTTVAALLANSVDLSQFGAVHVALLAVAICAGGVCLSHVNDAGFWVVSRYFGISEVTMLRTWTVGVTIMGVVAMAITTALWFTLGN
jgi:GntP family gluconate:H+ symporter